MLQIKTFVFNPLQENTIVVHDETRQAVIIDPGCYEPHERKVFDDYVASMGLQVVMILNTHCHFDHVLGNAYTKEKYHAPLHIGDREISVLHAIPAYISNYGFNNYQPSEPDFLIKESDKITFGNTVFDVLFLPGHSPGHLGFYCDASRVIFSGDVLFYRSIGRTDLPGGDYDTLIDSIHNKLFNLPDGVEVYPGHGPVTYIREEKAENPFCALGTTNE